MEVQHNSAPQWSSWTVIRRRLVIVGTLFRPRSRTGIPKRWCSCAGQQHNAPRICPQPFPEDTSCGSRLVPSTLLQSNPTSHSQGKPLHTEGRPSKRCLATRRPVEGVHGLARKRAKYIVSTKPVTPSRTMQRTRRQLRAVQTEPIERRISRDHDVRINRAQ